LGNHRDWPAADAAATEFVAQRAIEHVPERALQVGARVVHRHRRDLLDRELGAPQDEADLRPVPVREHDVPSRLDHVGDIA